MTNVEIETAILGLPPHMHDGLRNYIFRGVMPGGFLTALFENDLVQTYARADHINIEAIPRYAGFLWRNAPAGCWGSSHAIRKWCEMGGLLGIEQAIEEDRA